MSLTAVRRRKHCKYKNTTDPDIEPGYPLSPVVTDSVSFGRLTPVTPMLFDTAASRRQ